MTTSCMTISICPSRFIDARDRSLVLSTPDSPIQEMPNWQCLSPTWLCSGPSDHPSHDQDLISGFHNPSTRPLDPRNVDSRNSNMTAAWKPLSGFCVSGSPDARILLATVPSHYQPSMCRSDVNLGHVSQIDRRL
jgi:hypothetical protein